MTMTTNDQAVATTTQHKKPCHDCPWRKKSIPGWLGDKSAADWLADVHSEAQVDCHAHVGPQCAGAAIYLANVRKWPRSRSLLMLPADTKRVFPSPQAFAVHHTGDKEWKKTMNDAFGLSRVVSRATAMAGETAALVAEERTQKKFRAAHAAQILYDDGDSIVVKIMVNGTMFDRTQPRKNSCGFVIAYRTGPIPRHDHYLARWTDPPTGDVYEMWSVPKDRRTPVVIFRTLEAAARMCDKLDLSWDHIVALTEVAR